MGLMAKCTWSEGWSKYAYRFVCEVTLCSHRYSLLGLDISAKSLAFNGNEINASRRIIRIPGSLARHVPSVKHAVETRSTKFGEALDAVGGVR